MMGNEIFIRNVSIIRCRREPIEVAAEKCKDKYLICVDYCPVFNL